MQIRKRDGRLVDFDANRIVNAIEKAMAETITGVDSKLSHRIANKIQNMVASSETEFTVEMIQDLVEEALMASSRKDVARAYILYRNERTKARKHPQWEMTELQKTIWENKYRYNNESFQEWLGRVSGGNEDIKKAIAQRKFLPAGRILAGRGVYKDGNKVTLSNCFVLPPPEDNIESIFDTAKEMARTYSWGGGVGIDISQLRPNKAKVNNAAKSTSGAVSFMDLYSLTTEIIGQHSRRGALMISIDCNHPDLLEFIKVKSDLNKVTKANISVKVTDDFMKAVKENREWTLKFNVKDTGEIIENTVNAKEVFNFLSKLNWNYAEPGVLFWDRIKSWHLLSEDKEFEYAGLNPCFTGDMRLLTQNGYMPFESLDNKYVTIINANGDLSKSKVWCSGEKDVIEIKLSNKKLIRCTPNHVFKLNDGSKCEAQNSLGKRIQVFYGKPNLSNDLFVQLGFLQGDGDLGRINSEYHKGLEVNIGYKDTEIFELFNITPIEGKHSYYINGFNDILIKYGFDGSQLPERVFPITYPSWTREQKLSFLKGCYSANGSVIKKRRISYKTTSKVFALQLKKAMFEFGITANITTNKPKTVKFKNGEYLCKESFDVNINKLNDIIIFYQNIGFIQQYKMDALVDLINTKSPMVISIKPLEKQKVYDFTEPITHWGVVEGIVVHNCAEEPLPAYGSCNLSSINLSEFVDFPFTDKAQFNFDKFKDIVKKAVIYMNEILDEAIEHKLYPLQHQLQIVKDYRQIGIGVMGIADMLIKMKLRYGSQPSLELCDKIGFEMINAALQQSALLAKEKGPFPKYKAEAILNSPFFKYNAYPETVELVKQYGLYNSQLLTIAPTGTISTMLGVSGGIEPIYEISFIRKTESLHDEDTYYKVFTPIAKEYMEKFGIDDEKDLPSYFVTAMGLDFYERIDMQAVWQKHIDASISSTVNLPFTTSVRHVEMLYMYAWEQGLKGVTIYRDGCQRQGILTTNNQQDYEKTTGDCKDCGGTNFIKVNGCSLCQDCGWSPCSI